MSVRRTTSRQTSRKKGENAVQRREEKRNRPRVMKTAAGKSKGKKESTFAERKGKWRLDFGDFGPKQTGRAREGKGEGKPQSKREYALKDKKE